MPDEVPSFGGTNGVASLDIGQPGSARRTAVPPTAIATVRTVIREPEVDQVETRFVQQNMSQVDTLGERGRVIEWQCVIKCDTDVTRATIMAEIGHYIVGYNKLTGAADPMQIRKTDMIDAFGRTYKGVVLREAVVMGPRQVTSDNMVLVQLSLRFREIGDVIS